MSYRRVPIADALAEEIPDDMQLSEEMKALASLRADLAFSTAQAARDSQARYEARLQKTIVRQVLLALLSAGRRTPRMHPRFRQRPAAWRQSSRRGFPANAMLYAVAVSDAGCELTVFEDGRSCSVVLDPAMVQQLVELLTRQSMK